MRNPYENFPTEAFWRPAVGGINPLEIENLWTPKLSLNSTDKVVTAGSCFAQHIGKALTRVGFNWFDAEPGPGPAEINRKFNYGVFSFRTGNIYTVSLLRQWIDWAFDPSLQSEEVWEKEGRFYDPFRPVIEPEGFASEAELRSARDATLAAIRRAVTEARVFVFTLGLTECWTNKATGVAYPMCPGTTAGTFDPENHVFKNYRYDEIYNDFVYVAEQMRKQNPDLQILLTVSPVPLTATASGDHVLVSTTYSKSVLRAVAGDLKTSFPFIDYFPSYEIITAPVFRGMFFKPNAREVSLKGVDFVMTHFFAGLNLDSAPSRGQPAVQETAPQKPSTPPDDGDVVCEEAALEAFSQT
jgi:hypothetical protein